MNRKEAQERIKRLRESISHHRYLYHVEDRQEISPDALDSLKKELSDLEQEFPDLITPDSPTQRVGGEPLPKFEKVRHEIQGELVRMNSLNDAFSEEDLREWADRFKRHTGKSIEEFYCDLKMDGLAIDLVYKKGLLVQASTRGNGEIGESVTANIKTIDAVPLSLYGDGPFPDELVVRGEVFLTKKEFERINNEQDKKGGKLYANPRNVAAGSVRQLNPKITASRKLNFFAYDIVGRPNDQEYLKEFPTKEIEYRKLKGFGIPVNPHGKTIGSLADVIKFRNHWEKNREELPYEIDGIVVSVNDNHLYNRAGIVGKTPRGAIAYKFSPREATTKVKNIIVSVGRTGTLTPIAVLEPVEIGGTTVSRATLHNIDEIRRLGVKIGDTVIVGRAGDVIPDIKKVIPELRSGNERNFKMPTKCPVCGEPVRQAQGEVAIKCVNKNCPALRREAIYHVVSRSAFDIDGIGPQIINQLIDAGLVQDPADLFKLEKEELLNLERFADKSAQNAIDAISARIKIPLDKFIYALGIDHVGEETAFALARKFKSIEALRSASLEELQNIPDIGPIVAQSIFDWFRRPYNQKLVDKFISLGVKILRERPVKGSTKLSGKTFVLTGTLESMSREQAKDRIRELGGDVSSSVSKETDYVVAGAEPGSKYDRAQKLGVKVIDEKQFLAMIQ
ncbi:MAG: NAD-dependent DNA ligase LigA [Candidatus Yanofskybacteria bacterium]|nr:NAD-dependent DNA ligase LigA [Candidatus Yanofskybacteria bacterium]